MPSRENKPKKMSPVDDETTESSSNTGLYICAGVIVVLVALAAYFS